MESISIQTDLETFISSRQILKNQEKKLGRKKQTKPGGYHEKSKILCLRPNKVSKETIEKIEIGDKKRDVIRKMGYPDLTEIVNQPQIDVFAPGGVIVGINPFIEEWTYFGPDITAVVIFQDGQVIQRP